MISISSSIIEDSRLFILEGGLYLALGLTPAGRDSCSKKLLVKPMLSKGVELTASWCLLPFLCLQRRSKTSLSVFLYLLSVHHQQNNNNPIPCLRGWFPLVYMILVKYFVTKAKVGSIESKDLRDIRSLEARVSSQGSSEFWQSFAFICHQSQQKEILIRDTEVVPIIGRIVGLI